MSRAPCQFRLLARKAYFAMVSFSALISLAATITGVQAHSWIHCSDYRGDRSNYQPEHCHGHPRPDNGRVPQMYTFGVDFGFNEQPDTTCHVGAADELDGYPMARYKQGQEITLAWPSKNHVAASCTNPYIPDTSLELFVAPKTSHGHPDDFEQVQASFSDEPHVNGSIDFKGFQNCPAFCENMDKALCTGTFRVPAGLTDGYYTFQWKWVFNSGTAPYITCFEAYVGQDVSPVPSPTPIPTTEGQIAQPTAQVTQENCTIAQYGQCAGGSMSGGCCAGGLTCFRQSQWYSQCLTACPSGWECENQQPATPAPVPNPTPAPVAKPTPAPVDPPTVEPSSEPTCGGSPSALLDVNVCPVGFAQEGKLVKAEGELGVSATLSSACECAHFCDLFGGPLPAYWKWNPTNQNCSCYATAKKFKSDVGSWVGVTSTLAGSTV